MSSEQKTAEEFLREKLISEISKFGDGMTEFYTRDLEHLLKCLEEKDEQIKMLKAELDKYNLAEKSELYKDVEEVNEFVRHFNGMGRLERMVYVAEINRNLTASKLRSESVKNYFDDRRRAEGILFWNEKCIVARTFRPDKEYFSPSNAPHHLFETEVGAILHYIGVMHEGINSRFSGYAGKMLKEDQP